MILIEIVSAKTLASAHRFLRGIKPPVDVVATVEVRFSPGPDPVDVDPEDEWDKVVEDDEVFVEAKKTLHQCRIRILICLRAILASEFSKTSHFVFVSDCPAH